MDITTNAGLLITELRLLEKIAASKSTLPILTTVLIKADDKLRLYATDLEVGLSTECPALISMPGSFALSAKKFLGIVDQLVGDVRMTHDGTQVKVSAGSFKSTLQCLPARDFPPIPQPEGQGFTVSFPGFCRLIDCTQYAVADSHGRADMSGTLLSLTGGITAMVATDGKRLSVATLPNTNTEEISALLPIKTLNMLKTVAYTGDIEFSKSDRHLFFGMGPRVLFSRMLDSKFPNYDRAIPKDCDKHVSINRVAWAAALRRVGQVAEESKTVSLAFTPGSLLINGVSAQVGAAEEVVPITYDGPALTLAAHYEHLLNFLDVAVSPSVAIELKDDRALLLKDGEPFLNVVMCVRS